MQAVMFRNGAVVTDMPKAVLATLAAANALLGVGLAALGVYLLHAETPLFSSHIVPICILALGLTTMYFASVATTGVVIASPGHIRVAAVVGLAVLFCEVVLIAGGPLDPIGLRKRLWHPWKKVYTSAPLLLQRVEHMYGCCGYQSESDMPSHKNCARLLEGRVVYGCAGPMTQAMYLSSDLAFRWSTAAMVVQLLILVVSSYVVPRLFVTDRTWLMEGDGRDGGWEAPGIPPITATPLAGKATPAQEVTGEASGENPERDPAPSLAASAKQSAEIKKADSSVGQHLDPAAEVQGEAVAAVAETTQDAKGKQSE